MSIVAGATPPVLAAVFMTIFLTVTFRWAGRRFAMLANAISQVRVRVDGEAEARRELAAAREDFLRIRSSRRVDVLVTGTSRGTPVTMGQSLELSYEAGGEIRFGPFHTPLDAGAHVVCFGGYMSDVLVGINSQVIYSDNVGMRLAVTSSSADMGVQLLVRVRREREYPRDHCC